MGVEKKDKNRYQKIKSIDCVKIWIELLSSQLLTRDKLDENVKKVVRKAVIPQA